MHEIQAQVLNVEGKTSKSGKPYFHIALSDGQKYTAFDANLAQQAHALSGQQVAAQVDVSQDGQFTNYKLIAIRPASASAAQLGVGSVIPANGINRPVPIQPIPLAPAPQGRGRDPEVEARIVRQSSMSTAFNFVGHVLSGSGDIEAATGHALALAKDIFNHAFHGSSRLDGDVVAQNGSEVAAQVNQVLEGAVSVGATTPTPDW